MADPEVAAVVLTGPAGAGKTRLARQLTAAAPLPPMWWQASPAVSGVPFGALAAVVDLTDDATPAATFTRIAGLAADAGGVIVVDDAPHLDARSADVLQRLVDAGKATVVATAREGVAVPAWMEWLWLGERTRHHTLGPLAGDDVAALVDEVLADQPAAERTGLARALGARTGGNALFVREMLVDLRRRADDGLPVGDIGDAPPHLLRVLEARLAAAGPTVTATLESVAVLGSIPLAQLIERCGRDGVAEAERTGHVVVGDDPRATVRPAHPLHAEATLAAMTVVERRTTTEAVARAVLADPALTSAERLTAVAALLDAGAPAPPDQILEAARSAFAALDHDLATRLAQAAVVAGDPFEARVILGAAHSGAGRPELAEEALRAALAVAADDDQRARAAGRLSVHLVAHGRRIAEASALLDEVAASLTDPAAVSFLDADRAKLASIRGDLSTLPAEVADGDDVAALNGAIVGAYAHAMAGDPVACRTTIARALPLSEAHQAVLPWSGELVRFSGVFAALSESGPEAAAAEAHAGLARAAEVADGAVGTWRFLLGLAEGIAGRSSSAIAALATASAELADHDLIGAQPLALAAHASSAAQIGQLDLARSLLDRSVEAAAVDGRVRTQVAVADAWCDALEGRASGAADKLALAALEAAEGGQLVSALLVVHEMIRLGAPRAAGDVLSRVARGAPSTWLVAWVGDRARAEVAGDDSALARLIRRADGGWPVAVAELHSARSTLARARGDDVVAARSALAAVRAAEALGDARPWTLRDLASPLTAGEQEVVDAVLGGASSRQVAEDRGVSVRTVDNQLQSVYRKLGLAGRKDLAPLLAP